MSFEIALNLVSSHASLYSLQQAAVLQSAVSSNGASTITLYDNGCDFYDQNDEFHRNCKEACIQPSVVWDSPFTVHNCLIYSTISGLIAKDNLTVDDRERAIGLGYLPDFDLPLIEEPANICMRSFCVQQQVADPTIDCTGISINRTDFSHATQGQIHNFLTKGFIKNACGAFKASPNVDVGGIGVYIGYLMQLSILLYCWLHSRLISNWPYFLTLFNNLNKSKQHADHLQTRSSQTHQFSALISGLQEFQQAQSYFALTLNGTAIGALTSNGAMFDVQSLQQMRLTVDLLGDVAATAIICLTFGLYMLQAANKRTWYVTILSLLAILVSFTTWILTTLPLKNLHVVTVTQHDLPACGNRSPATFCLDTTPRKSIVSEASCIAICLLTTVVMMRRQFRIHPFASIGSSVTSSSILRRALTLSTTSSRARSFTTMIWNWRQEMAELILAGMTILMLVQLITKNEMLEMRDKVQWTFAQLIAVTIWVPCIVEYFYAMVRRWSLRTGEEVGRRGSVDERVQTCEWEEGFAENGIGARAERREKGEQGVLLEVLKAPDGHVGQEARESMPEPDGIV